MMLTARTLLLHRSQNTVYLSQFFFARNIQTPTPPVTSDPKLPKRIKATEFSVFDPSKSKYGVSREAQVKEKVKERKDAPEYLKNEQVFQELTQKHYQLENPVQSKEAAQKRTSLDEKKTNKQLQIRATDPIAKKVAMTQHQRKLQNFDRFNEEFVANYMQERQLEKGKLKNKSATQQASLDQFINVSNVGDFQKPERVSKRLSRMGICSRRVAEKLIEQGMIQVDGQIIKENVPVTNTNLLQVSAKSGIYTPVKENTRIWLFHKPQNLVTTHFDPQGRLTVFDRLKDLGLNIPHVLSVGRLDYLSEGLLIITNDGDLARALELPSYRLERQYRVRVFGRMFNEEKLQRIRNGIVMNGLRYGPYLCEIENRQNTNTWLHMKLYEGRNNEIRRVMRKLSLRVNRLIRIKYGPYSLGLVPQPNDLAEVSVTEDIRSILYRYYKSRAKEGSQRLLDAQNQLTISESDANKMVDDVIGPSQSKKQLEMSEDEEDDQSDFDSEPATKRAGFGQRLLNNNNNQ